MHTALWVVQVVLGLAFIAAGAMKALKTGPELKEAAGSRMDWVDDLSPGQLKTIGILEVLGGIGLILPPAVGVLPILTPIAATGLVLTMLGAMALHVRRKEFMPTLLTNAFLAGLGIFVAVGRFGPEAF